MGEFDPVQLPFDIEVVLEVPDMAPNSKPDRMRKDEEEEESSLSSVRGSGADSRISGGGGSTGGGGSRRRLPATPQSVRKNTHKVSNPSQVNLCSLLCPSVARSLPDLAYKVGGNQLGLLAVEKDHKIMF